MALVPEFFFGPKGRNPRITVPFARGSGNPGSDEANAAKVTLEAKSAGVLDRGRYSVRLSLSFSLSLFYSPIFRPQTKREKREKEEDRPAGINNPGCVPKKGTGPFSRFAREFFCGTRRVFELHSSVSRPGDPRPMNGNGNKENEENGSEGKREKNEWTGKKVAARKGKVVHVKNSGNGARKREEKRREK